MNSPALLEKFLKRDRWIVLCGLISLSLLGWIYLLKMAQDMGNMPMIPTGLTPWSIGDVFWLFLMWAVMMVAMMIPSAALLILTYAVIHRKRFDQKDTFSCTVIFLSGYLAIWTAFSLVAALIQWGLHTTALLSPMMVSKSAALSGGLLIIAGIYQWMPLKQTCLAHCRSPIDFFMTNQLAQWQRWCICNGRSSRYILRRMLLAPHGTSLCCGGDDVMVGRCNCCFCIG